MPKNRATTWSRQLSARATTADRFLDLSDDARRIYRHLLVRWLTVGETVWTRRHIHQDMKGAARFRRIAGLCDPLAELIQGGLLVAVDTESYPKQRSPLYALAQPFLPHDGRLLLRRTRVIPAPPLPRR